MFLQKFPLKVICSIPLIVSLISCTSVGTILLPKNREGFNAAMITSEEQQLLLNLVRTIFDDRPYFMTIESITTSNSLSSSGGANFSYSPSVNSNSNVNSLGPFGEITPDTSRSFSRSFGIGHSLSFSPNVSYSDSPTISFAPLQGEKFTRQMLTPLPLSTVALLLNSGWGAGKIMRITVEWLDGLFNESRLHSGPVIPNNQPFVSFVDELRALQQDNLIYFEVGEITEVSID